MQRNEKIPRIFKILLLGDKGVAKSSLLRRFVDNTFDPDYQSSIGVQFMTREVRYEDESVKLVIWDIAGQSKHTTYRHLYYKATQGVILVYDVMRADSIEHLPRLLGDVLESTNSDIKIAVLGIESDLSQLRAVSQEDGEYFAKSINAEIFSETNIKTGRNIEALFLALAKALVERDKKYDIY